MIINLLFNVFPHVPAQSGRCGSNRTPGEPLSFVFSGNWGAVIGVYLCSVVLAAWIVWKVEDNKKSDEDET